MPLPRTISPIFRNRIWFLSSRISALTAGTAEQKLAVYLLEQGDMEISMTDLSQRLNLGRASLYRAAEELEELGAIAREGKRVKVLERDAFDWNCEENTEL